LGEISVRKIVATVRILLIAPNLKHSAAFSGPATRTDTGDQVPVLDKVRHLSHFPGIGCRLAVSFRPKIDLRLGIPTHVMLCGVD
jgi:hypothetical protein